MLPLYALLLLHLLQILHLPAQFFFVGTPLGHGGGTVRIAPSKRTSKLRKSFVLVVLCCLLALQLGEMIFMTRLMIMRHTPFAWWTIPPWARPKYYRQALHRSEMERIQNRNCRMDGSRQREHPWHATANHVETEGRSKTSKKHAWEMSLTVYWFPSDDRLRRVIQGRRSPPQRGTSEQIVNVDQNHSWTAKKVTLDKVIPGKGMLSWIIWERNR